MTPPTPVLRAAYVLADPGIPAFGRKGSTLHVQEVIRAMATLGIEVHLIATRFDEDPPPALPVAEVHRVTAPPKGNTAFREQACLDLNEDVTSLLASTGPYDFVYERYSLWSFAGMAFARAQGIPGILEVNAPLIDEQATYRELIHRDEAKSVAQRAFRDASLVTVVSQELVRYVRTLASKAKPLVIPNGINPDRFAHFPVPSRDGDTDPFVIGFLGHLKPWQGITQLVQTFAQVHQTHPHTRLLVVGDGDASDELVEGLKNEGLTDKATLAGKVPHDDVPALLAQMHVGLAPYPPLDPFYFSPLKIVEYMAAGLPVIASDLGQIPSLLSDGETGYLCPPGDVHALARSVCALADHEWLRRRLGEQAKKHVLKKHTWAAGVQQILAQAGLEATV